MKILYIHQYFRFPDQNGGTRSYDLSRRFVEEGINVEILSSSNKESYKNNKWNTVSKDGIVIHFMYLPYDNSISYFKRIIYFIKFIWHSSFKALAIKADVLLATSTPLTIGITALIKKWLHGTPYIFEIRDVWPEAVIAIGAIKNKFIQYLLFALEKIIYINASALIPLSTDMKESIISRYSLKDKPVIVIENISEIKRFRTNISKEACSIQKIVGYKPRFAILYAGTFGKVNGIEYVVKLAEIIYSIDKTIVFILIGEGAYKENIIKIAEQKGLLNKNIFIEKSISKNDLVQMYFEAEMGSSFVIPIKELWANSANKFFDTLAAGKPILINYGGWQKEVIEKENVGYILPSMEEEMTEELVKKFVDYTNNYSMHNQQCMNAIQLAQENYSLDVASRKYINLFDKVI